MTRESDIQNAIRVALSKYGVVFRLNSGDFWQGKRIYSEEFKQPVLINLRRVQGLPAGTADLLFIGNGRVVFIETKTKSGKPSPDQLNFIDRMSQLGITAGVARSVDEAIKLINQHI